MESQSAARSGDVVYVEDLELARRAAGGNAQARRQLVRRVFGRAQRIARALLGNATDAEDAAQECMLELLASAKGYRGQAPLERWADRVVVRSCRRWGHRQHRRESRIDASITPDQLQRAPGLALANERVPRPVADYLDRLPEPQREVLVLRHVLGFSLAEIGEQVDAKERTVRYRLSAGLQTLRGLIRRDCAIGVGKGVQA